MTTWFHHLGFKENPLSTKPLRNLENVESYNEVIKRIAVSIKQGKIIAIEGKYGTGKTSIIHKIIQLYKGDKKVIYYNVSRAEEKLDLNRLIIQRTFWTKLFRVRSKNLLLILDEAELMNEKDAKNIINYYSKGYFHSVVLVEKSAHLLPEPLKSQINKYLFKTDVLTEQEAIKLIQSRLKKLDIISQEQILRLYHFTEKNPRKLLMKVEEVCKRSLKKENKVQDKDIQAILEQG